MFYNAQSLNFALYTFISLVWLKVHCLVKFNFCKGCSVTSYQHFNRPKTKIVKLNDGNKINYKVCFWPTSKQQCILARCQNLISGHFSCSFCGSSRNRSECFPNHSFDHKTTSAWFRSQHHSIPLNMVRRGVDKEKYHHFHLGNISFRVVVFLTSSKCFALVWCKGTHHHRLVLVFAFFSCLVSSMRCIELRYVFGPVNRDDDVQRIQKWPTGPVT